MPRKAKEKDEKTNKTSKISQSKNKVTKSKTTATRKKSTKKEVTKTKKTTKKKSTSTSKKSPAKSTRKKVTTNVEYYDLPFRYNQTVVKILAQTPSTLFIYWDISDKDKAVYLEKYGENFFKNSKPILLITNKTMNYTFEVEINDYSNSWYLHINDANCEYKVELCRKHITYNSNLNESNLSNNYVHITSSNEIETPNNHILLDKIGKSVFFRNIKTNIIEEKSISSISFLQKIGDQYNIYNLYKEMYKDELLSDEFGLNLPSSNSSTFK